ncbi:RICIN domain-containing protein [Actinokineospora fastidiosa]|uniref:RICIN domain-containing protein n=1 Tax=Actinokineospora fastidiosa TaxID=1816 RepID=UPI0016710FDE|nr:RICIN domain-containing protein [Actinokineospora fastidiosa]
MNRHTAIAYDCHGGDNQFWQLESLGTNIYRVRNLGSGECLHQKYDGSTPTTTVQVLACTDANWINQRWRVTEWNDGSYTFKNVRSEWFLDQSLIPQVGADVIDAVDPTILRVFDDPS